MPWGRGLYKEQLTGGELICSLDSTEVRSTMHDGIGHMAGYPPPENWDHPPPQNFDPPEMGFPPELGPPQRWNPQNWDPPRIGTPPE